MKRFLGAVSVFGFVFLVISCGKMDNDVNLASGCKLDTPIDIGTTNLNQGRDKMLVFGGLKLQKDSTIYQGAMLSRAKLVVREIMEQTMAGDYVGTKRTSGRMYSMGVERGLPYEIGKLSNYSTGDKTADSKVLTSTKLGKDNDATEFSILMDGTQVLAMELSYPIQNGLETLCVKSATLEQRF